VQAAIRALAAVLGIPEDQIEVIDLEAVEWPDACLGIIRIDALCAQGITPGYRVILEAQGKQYEYHTNQDGSAVALAFEGDAETQSAAEQAVISALAESLGIDPSEIKVVSTQVVEWPDACLGVYLPGKACAEVITPGFLIVVEADGKRYEYHTNLNASTVQPATQAVFWSREGGIAGFDDHLYVYLPDEVYAEGRSGEGAAAGKLFELLGEDELVQFNDWLERFGMVEIEMKDPAVADQMTLRLVLQGFGSQQPTVEEEQALMAFAQDLFNKVKR